MTKAISRAWLLPLLAVAWNQGVYYGGHLLAYNAPHRNLELWLDPLIPFLPWTVSIYLGCFVFWGVFYLYMARAERCLALRFFLTDCLAKAVCLVFFVLLPTTNLRPPVPGDGLWEELMRFVYRVDAPTNLFPSIHCLVSWLCFVGARSLPRFPRWGVWLTGLTATAICLSTLTTRQHVLVDVLGGILLAEVSYRAAGHPLFFRPYSRLLCRLMGGAGPDRPAL